MKAKFPLPTIVIGILLAIVLVQSFFVLPRSINQLDSMVTLVACDAAPIKVITDAVSEELAKVKEGTKIDPRDQTPFSSRYCLFKNEVFTTYPISNNFVNENVSIEFTPMSVKYYEITEHQMEIYEDIISSGVVSCTQSQTGFDCSIFFWGTPIHL